MPSGSGGKGRKEGIKKSVSKLKVSDKLMEIKRNTIRFHKLKRIPSFKKRKRKKTIIKTEMKNGEQHKTYFNEEEEPVEEQFARSEESHSSNEPERNVTLEIQVTHEILI